MTALLRKAILIYYISKQTDKSEWGELEFEWVNLAVLSKSTGRNS